jgi:hydroxyacylglutathione hydrolase
MYIKTKTLTVGSLQANCYLVTKDKETLIIDPGDEGDFISQIILENNLNPKAIILTHGHFDHCLGILPLKLNFNIPIYLHQKDIFLYKQAGKSAKYWTGSAGDPPPPVDKIITNKTRKIFFLKVIETPGHTPGSICLHYQNHSSEAAQSKPSDGEILESENEILFTGDTLFANGVGRTDFSYSSKQDLKKSLQKIEKLPNQTIHYPGHGELFKINS